VNAACPLTTLSTRGTPKHPWDAQEGYVPLAALIPDAGIMLTSTRKEPAPVESIFDPVVTGHLLAGWPPLMRGRPWITPSHPLLIILLIIIILSFSHALILWRRTSSHHHLFLLGDLGNLPHHLLIDVIVCW
jgi:hypothetical protein